MRYINREYGFEGRPPYFKEFHEEQPNGDPIDASCYPERGFVGLGMERGKPNGALVEGPLGTVWGVDFSCQKGGRWLSSDEMAEEGLHFFAVDPTGRFRYLCHGDLTVSMARYDATAFVISVSSLRKMSVRLRVYPVAPKDAEFSVRGQTVFGRAAERAVIQGQMSLAETDVVIRNRYEVLFEKGEGRVETMIACFYGEGMLKSDEATGGCSMESTLFAENSRVLLFVGLGDRGEVPTKEELLRGVSDAELRYSAEKTAGSGPFAEGAPQIISRIASHGHYDPLRRNTEWTEEPKQNARNPYTMAWSVLIAALAGLPSADQTEAYCTEPHVGVLAAWIYFCRTRDRALLFRCYRQWKAAFLPDCTLVRRAGNAYVGENALKLLGFDLLWRAARILSDGDAAVEYRKAYADFAELFHREFYDETTGMYRDRDEEGNPCGVAGAASFVPLVTGAINDNDVLDAVISNLADPERFWGDCPVATADRRHPGYGKNPLVGVGAAHLGGSGKGETSAYLDFLVWLGLVRAGAGDLANELALAVGRTAKAYRKKYDAVPSSLNKNAKGEQSKPKDALSGNLFGLIGMLSLLDVEYFRSDLRPAVRFGTLEQGDHRLVNVKLFGRNFSVVKDQDKTVLSVDGKHVFEGIGAPFVVRQFAACEEGAEFLLYASGALTLAVRTPVFAAAEPSSLYRFNVEGGRFRIRLQRHRVDVSAI